MFSKGLVKLPAACPELFDEHERVEVNFHLASESFCRGPIQLPECEHDLRLVFFHEEVVCDIEMRRNRSLLVIDTNLNRHRVLQRPHESITDGPARNPLVSLRQFRHTRALSLTLPIRTRADKGRRANLVERDLSVVGEAADAEEGVRLARQLKPKVVLPGIELPGPDGLQ